jgi:hypothetical protein
MEGNAFNRADDPIRRGEMGLQIVDLKKGLTAPR